MSGPEFKYVVIDFKSTSVHISYKGVPREELEKLVEAGLKGDARETERILNEIAKKFKVATLEPEYGSAALAKMYRNNKLICYVIIEQFEAFTIVVFADVEHEATTFVVTTRTNLDKEDEAKLLFLSAMLAFGADKVTIVRKGGEDDITNGLLALHAEMELRKFLNLSGAGGG